MCAASSLTYAAAPARSGQPYAESICTTDPNIILCEDFNYPANFPCDGEDGTWVNPGLIEAIVGTCAGRVIDQASNYAAQPAGSPAGGYVRRANPDDGEGMVSGCLWSDCERSTSDSTAGVTYQNGAALTNDLYIRFQVYFSADYKWPDFDNKIFFLWPDRYTDKPSASLDAGMLFGNGVFCPSINENFNDALSFRVGDNSCSFKIYPSDNTAGCHPEHTEYCDGEGFGNNSPPVSEDDPPDDTPHPGTIFRFRKATWYTVEFRYKLGTAGDQNGTIEAWINGTKVYSDNDLATCGDGTGSCVAAAEFAFYNWYNFFQEGPGVGGYGLSDNLIISKAYIGPPNEGGGGVTQVPSAPTGVSVTP
jgi:hypothetical protein